MEKQQNKFISLVYKLYTVDDKGNRTLMEEATTDRPFDFISGMGVALDGFEQKVKDLEKGAEFSIDLSKGEAYGEYHDEHVITVGRETFTINGHFDHEHIYQDAIVPLQDPDGHHFYGKVVEITDENVKLDMNHPLAGKNLHFDGKILENREATNQEIEHLAKLISGEADGCGCGCDHDHDSCGCDHDHDGCGCGCHHDH